MKIYTVREEMEFDGNSSETMVSFVAEDAAHSFLDARVEQILEEKEEIFGAENYEYDFYAAGDEGFSIWEPDNYCGCHISVYIIENELVSD